MDSRLIQPLQKIRALKQNDVEERFFAAFNDANVGFTKVGLNGEWLHVNAKLCELTGYTEEELLRLKFQDITHPDDVDADLINMQKVLNKELGINLLEKRYIRKDGGIVWAHLTATLIRDAEDKPLYFIALIEDITERKMAEKKLKESEERYNLVLYGSNDGFYDWDVQKDTVYWSKRFYEIIGLSEEGSVEKAFDTFIKLIHPEDKEKILAEISNYLSQAGKYEMAFRIRHQSGDYRYVVCRGCSFFDNEGNPARLSGVIQDVTGQKLAEESLRKSLKENKSIKFALDQSTIVAITDKKGTITYVNDAFCKISKYSAEELIGQNHRIVNSGYHPRTFFRKMWATIGKGEVWKGEIKNKAKDGSYYWVYTTIVPFIDDRGVPYEYVAIRFDITEQKEMSLQIEEARELAETANKKKSQFLANMSHELRTPLNAIIGYSEMLESAVNGELTEKQRKYIHNVVVSGHHLLSLINDVLDLSKIEADKLTLSCEWVVLKSLLEELKVFFEGQATQKNVKLYFSQDEAVGGVHADPIRLKQIFINLLSNAIKFNRPNGTVSVKVSLSDDKQLVVCTIEDTGIGIPEDKIPELFSEFYQVDNSYSRKEEGAGLGLALTKRLVELHGGTIALKSQVNVGSTFTFTLPTRVRSFGRIRQ